MTGTLLAYTVHDYNGLARSAASGLDVRPQIAELAAGDVPQGRNDGFDLETEARLLKKWHAKKD